MLGNLDPPLLWLTDQFSAASFNFIFRFGEKLLQLLDWNKLKVTFSLWSHIFVYLDY